MLYNQKSFTLPTSNTQLSQRDWDYAFLTSRDFLDKYGEDAEEYREICGRCGKLTPDIEWTTNWGTCNDCSNEYLDKYYEEEEYAAKQGATESS